MTKNVLLLAAFALTLLACRKKDYFPATDLDQVVFGVGYAECAGNCAVSYKLTQTQLLGDTCDYCFWYAVGFDTIPLADEKFQIAQPLFESIPAILLKSEETVYGCPGCIDEGGWHLEITQNGKKHLIRWSSSFDEVPKELRPYFENVMQILRDLN